MDKRFNIEDQLSFAEKASEHGLRGHVTISLENKETGETKLWYENDNTITISGFQWILLKCFGLYLDSVHDPSIPYEDPGQDTTIVIPDLNKSDTMGIGIDPANYTVMAESFGSNNIIQGFMIGNGGSGEDGITTKNTDYSFIKLRNPIPFQQITGGDLDSSIAGKYLGVYRDSATKSYFIKKFDDRPHIYHNWWREGQKWDYSDPVTTADLGPGSQNTPKTNRIETYVEMGMSIDTNNHDCIDYFTNSGNNQTAMINELGLVAFDTVPGARSIAEAVYNNIIKKLLNAIFSVDRDFVPSSEADIAARSTLDQEVITLAGEVYTALNETLYNAGQQRMNNFIDTMRSLSTTTGSVDYGAYQDSLSEENSINVEAYYNMNHEYIYEQDEFLTLLQDQVYADLTVDEAQRIKMITYYTFNAIPLQTNWKILINYRIYAN